LKIDRPFSKPIKSRKYYYLFELFKMLFCDSEALLFKRVQISSRQYDLE